MKAKRVLSFFLVVVLSLSIVMPIGSAAGPIIRTYSMTDAGTAHTLALKSDGTVWGWGANALHQLGQPKADDYREPVQIVLQANAVAVAAGYDSSAAITASGGVYCWGGIQVTPFEVPALKNVVAVECGQAEYIALTSSGEVWQWSIGGTPKKVSGLPAIANIDAGSSHFMALSNNGAVWAWGGNWGGQLGTGDKMDRATPTQIAELENVIDIAAGYSHSLAVTHNGLVYAWGANGYGELGTGDTKESLTPVKVEGIKDALQVSAGYESSLARSSGGVYSWGYGEYGQTGNGSSATTVSTPRLVSNSETAVHIVSGTYHNVLVKKKGQLFCWGRNRNYQLGNNSNINGTTPKQILSGIEVTTTYDTEQLVGASDWALPELESLYKRSFIPPALWSNYKDNMTRAQFAQMLVSVYESVKRTEVTYDANSTKFTDLTGHPLRAYMLKANVLGIMDGKSATTAAPDANVTRQEMAKMLCTFIVKMQGGAVPLGVTETPYYSDADEIAKWAVPYVAYAHDKEIMKGTGTGFSPKELSTFQQGLVVMERLAEKYKWSL